MAAAAFFICSDARGHHERSTPRCGVHQRTATAYCVSCGEQLWDKEHQCR